MAGKLVQTIICLSILSVPCVCLAANQTTCEEWLDSIKEYDNQVKLIIQGEPGELVKTLWDIIYAKEKGRTEEAETLQNNVREKVAALKTIKAPQDLRIFHAKLISYGTAVETAIDAILQHDAALRSIEVRNAYVSILNLYMERESLLIHHQCENEALRVIQKKIIPDIKDMLKQFPPELFER